MLKQQSRASFQTITLWNAIALFIYFFFLENIQANKVKAILAGRPASLSRANHPFIVERNALFEDARPNKMVEKHSCLSAVYVWICLQQQRVKGANYNQGVSITLPKTSPHQTMFVHFATISIHNPAGGVVTLFTFARRMPNFRSFFNGFQTFPSRYCWPFKHKNVVRALYFYIFSHHKQTFCW